MAPNHTNDLLARIETLQARLDEAEETLSALRNGEVDAIVATGLTGEKVFTLQGADQAYRIMVEQMGEGALTLNGDGLILFSNDAFATMLGRPLESVIGARLHDFVAPADAPVLHGLLNGGAAAKAELRLILARGANLPVYLSLRNVTLNGAACQCAIVTNLSEQKRYDEIAAVLEAVPVGVLIAGDAACRNVVGNRMALELLRQPSLGGVSMAPIDLDAAKTWRQIKDGMDLPDFDLPLQTAARTGRRVSNVEFDVLFEDGGQSCFLKGAVPLLNELGQSRGAVGAFIDITELRRTSEALEAANVELRNFGNALTRDLNEPIRVLVDSTRLLAREFPEKYVLDSLASAVKIEDLLNALLAYWKVSEGSGTGLSPVDCNQVLAHTLAKLGPEIAQSGATVTFGSLPVIAADPAMLEQLFLTLIGNALQYRGAAPPVVHISALDSSDRWLFRVHDNGIGIERKDAESIFGMFTRLHGPEIPGTGIGLALCKKIVERLGGRIWVESRPGQGAEFRFTLPSSPAPV